MSVTPGPAEQRLTTSTATQWLHPSGYVVVDQTSGVTQTAESATAMFDSARTLVPEDEWLPMLVLANQSRADRSARSTFALIGVSHTAAVALVVRSRVATMTGNFFLRVNKPDFPVQLFGTPEEAAVWLQSYVGRPRS